jgi:hypothetical protein
MIILLSVLLGIVFIALVFVVILLRGAIVQQQIELSSYKRKDLSGREIETMRRLIVAKGPSAITVHDVLNLIYTIRSIQLGDYSDIDPFVFSSEDPYDSLELEMKR